MLESRSHPLKAQSEVNRLLAEQLKSLVLVALVAALVGLADVMQLEMMVGQCM